MNMGHKFTICAMVNFILFCVILIPLSNYIKSINKILLFLFATFLIISTFFYLSSLSKNWRNVVFLRKRVFYYTIHIWIITRTSSCKNITVHQIKSGTAIQISIILVVMTCHIKSYQELMDSKHYKCCLSS